MKTLRTIASTITLLTILSGLLLYYTKFTDCMVAKEIINNVSLLNQLQGEREFAVVLFLGLFTSFLFALVPAWIAYINRKRELEYNLRKMYLKLKRMCYERLFYEENSFDNDSEETNKIMDFLNDSYHDVFEYHPIITIYKIKALRFINRIIKPQKDDNYDYRKENLYGLIISVYMDISKRFIYISLCQKRKNDLILLRKLSETIKHNSQSNRSAIFLEKNEIDQIEENTNLKNLKPYYYSLSKKDIFLKFCAIDEKMFSNVSFKKPESALSFEELMRLNNYDIINNFINYKNFIMEDKDE